MAGYLVTGGAGFIGSHLVETLLERNEHITVLDNLSTGIFQNIKPFLPDITFIKGDICDEEQVRTAVKGCDFILHQAAIPSVPKSVMDPVASNAANINGTLNLLIAARDFNVKRFVFACSSSVYGFDPSIPKIETQPTIPRSPYALTKLTGESYCRLFFDLYGLETVALRYFNIFGPRQNPDSQYAAVVPNFISKMLHNESPVIHSDGEQSRDFTFVENVVAANLNACSVPEIGGEVFNIGCGTRITINELYRTLANLIGFQGDPLYTETRQGDVRHSIASIEKAAKLLNYDPQVSLHLGLERTVAFFKTI